MISNLEAYSEWKKSTLKRLTLKHRLEFMKVIDQSLKRVRPILQEGLETGVAPTWAPGARLQGQLQSVLDAHLTDTVDVAIADGIRETSKLSRWDERNIYEDVERGLSFNELAKRNSYALKLAARIRKANAKRIEGFAKGSTKDYLGFVKRTFRELVADYYAAEDSDDTEATITEALKRIFRSTDARAETLFRTETTRYFNEARIGFFREDTDVDFVQLIAVTDGRISDICECRDGYVIPIEKAHLKKYQPPFHPNCRTVQSPLDTDLKADADEVKRNLGQEFGRVEAKEREYKGRRPVPPVPLPKGWV